VTESLRVPGSPASRLTLLAGLRRVDARYGCILYTSVRLERVWLLYVDLVTVYVYALHSTVKVSCNAELRV